MVITIVVVILFVLSFMLALRQLSEFHVPKEVHEVMASLKKHQRVWGVIVFLRDKVVHYSSESSPDDDR